MTGQSSRRRAQRSLSPREQRQSRSRSAEEVTTSSSSLRRSKRLAGEDPSSDDEYLEQRSFKRRFLTVTDTEESNVRGSLIQGTLESIPSPSDEPCGMITVGFISQPPLEVRTGSMIARLGVRVTIEATEKLANLGPSMGIGTLHAVVSLWSADGQVAAPHAVPPLLTGHKDATLININTESTAMRCVEANFTDLAISRSGYYRLRISVMETPIPEPDDEGIQSPRQLLSVESRPIHAYAFADTV